MSRNVGPLLDWVCRGGGKAKRKVQQETEVAIGQANAGQVRIQFWNRASTLRECGSQSRYFTRWGSNRNKIANETIRSAEARLETGKDSTGTAPQVIFKAIAASSAERSMCNAPSLRECISLAKRAGFGCQPLSRPKVLRKLLGRHGMSWRLYKSRGASDWLPEIKLPSALASQDPPCTTAACLPQKPKTSKSHSSAPSGFEVGGNPRSSSLSMQGSPYSGAFSGITCKLPKAQRQKAVECLRKSGSFNLTGST